MTAPALISVVLDQSGSMMSVADATVEGFNRFLAEQRAQPGDAWVSLTLFSTDFDVRYVAWGIADLPPLGGPANPYRPAGRTALYDAVGTTMTGIEGWLANNAWFAERDGRVLFVIQTDGQENSSRRWGIDQVNAAINAKRDAGWQFLFMGAGAGWLEARNFCSIPEADVLRYHSTPHDTMAAYGTAAQVVTMARRTRPTPNPKI